MDSLHCETSAVVPESRLGTALLRPPSTAVVQVGDELLSTVAMPYRCCMPFYHPTSQSECSHVYVKSHRSGGKLSKRKQDLFVESYQVMHIRMCTHED